MQILQKDLERFADWSGDHNPLHLDPVLARQSPFGQQISHGILAVIEAFRLGNTQAVKPVKSLDIEFQGAVFPDGLYDVKSDSRNDQLYVSVQDGSNTALIAKAHFRNGESPRPNKDLSWMKGLESSIESSSSQKRSFPANRVADDLQQGFELVGVYATEPPPDSYTSGSSLTPLELRVLGLCSYLVGMEIPGLRSLFTRLRLDLSQTDTSTDALIYQLRIIRFDKQFRILDTALEVATPEGEHVATGEIRSYVRFSPIVTDLDLLKSSLKSDSNNLEGKVALVCGGSRGLGADLAACLALVGCHVYVSYRKSSDAAEELKKRLEEKNASLNFLPGDAGDMEWCSSTLDTILKDHGRLDVVVLNACSPPTPMGISAELASEFTQYIDANLRLVQTPLSKFLPPIADSQGSIVAISSSFVEETPPDFGHYVALKQAVEGLMKSASRENPDIHFLIARPPRLQTSWNDTPTGVLGAIPADAAATCIVNRLNEGSSQKVDLLSDFSQVPTAETGDAAQAVSSDAEIHQFADPDLTLVVSASFTADILLRGLRFWFSELDLRAKAEIAPYGQVLQELLNPSSALSSNTKGVSVVLLRIKDLLRELPKETTESIGETGAYLTKTANEFIRAVRTHRRHTAVETLLVLCPSFISIKSEQDKTLAAVQENICNQLKGVPGLQVVVAQDFHPRYSVSDGDIEDPLRNEIAHVPYQDGYFQVLATIIVRSVHRKIVLPRKVVVLDCDNTLWNGVVGEVGAKGIEFNPIHQQLHELMTNLNQNGILVCLCSKNEEADVWEVFETREDFGLKRDQIVAAMINWNSKSQNIQVLASRLNLGLDSFIFIDDNPVECAEVRASCPGVLVLQWPETPNECEKLLQHTWEFDLVDGTKEDQKRTQMYRDEFQRQELKDEALSFKEFIENLDLKVDIATLNQEDLRRSSQLTLRTNQFNFTTRRRNENEVQQLVGNDSYLCKTVRVQDRFGDYGLVGFLIVERQDQVLVVDTFLLSCRVLGRGVEHRMAAELGRIGMELGFDTVRIRVETTKRNAPARKFLESIVDGHAQHCTDELLECDLQSSYLAELRFEPKGKGDGEANQKKVNVPKQSVTSDNENLRKREAQITRASFHLSTIADLQSAIDGTDSGRGAVPDQAASDVHSEDVCEQVYLAFSNALGTSVDELKRVDQLEAIGCSSFKIVEITVALTAQYSWLPSTLLFEHRSISEIVEEISQILEIRAKKDVSLDTSEHVSQPRGKEADDGSSTTDIAVVGLGIRCAEVNSADELWELLSSGRSSATPVPAQRSPKNGRSYWGGLLANADEFDAEFFGVSPREAGFMDPQLRLFLEVAWEALEDAGTTDTERFPDTGVYVGVMYGDYVFHANTLANIPDTPYRCWESFSLANRLSQVFGFSGPSYAVNTACSSSATALHLACKGLRAGECTTALVGGINLVLDPERLAQLDRLGIVSPSGKCCAFGADADGTIIGEGVGVVVLKPLSEAERNGNRIYGIIKGTALSTGAGTVGFTAPNPQAQAEAIRRSLQDAAIDPRTISYVEAHGTGTLLGDPIEIRGLNLAYNDKSLWDNRISGTSRCKIASIKPNVGHLEGGAGISSLIKVLLQFTHGFLAPTLNADRANPHIPFDKTPFELQHTLEPWEQPRLEFDGESRSFPRRAGVSSFGVGGANAHIILEEPPSTPPTKEDEMIRPLHILTLSARQKDTLRKQATRFKKYLESHQEISLEDICYTANVGRKHFEHRLAFLASNRDRTIRALGEFVAGEEPVGCIQGRAPLSGSPSKIAFLFTGQGAQYTGMGKALYDSHPYFRKTLDQCAEILSSRLDRSLLDILFAEEGSPEAPLLDQTVYTQPALFSIEYSLAKLWESWGVLPEVVMGHSVGEIAALCIAGGVSLEDGLKLIAARGRLMQALPPGGGMTSVRAEETIVKEAITAFEDRVSIAAFNSPTQTVISGDKDAIVEITTQLQSQGIKTTALTVSHAFHSYLMDPMIAEFKAVAEEITFSTPTIPFISGAKGEAVTDAVKDSDYWVRQVRDPVRFTAGMAALEKQSISTFLEVGPKPVLLGLGRQCFSSKDAHWLLSLRDGADAWQTLFGSLAQLHVGGKDVDWKAVDAPYSRKIVSIPTYPFKHKRYWIDIPETTNKGDGEALALVSARREKDEVTFHKNLYEVVWKKKPRAKSETPRDVEGLWVIFTDQDGVGDELTRVLTEKGEKCISVQWGDNFKRIDSGRFIVDPGNAGHYESLWRDVMSEAESIAAIVQLWGLDSAASADLDLEKLEHSQELTTESTLHLIQTLAKAPEPIKPAIWLVTRGATRTTTDDATDGPVSCAQTPLWGFGRTLSLENFGIWGGLLDLSPNGEPSAEAKALSEELLASDGEDQVALRNGQRYVPRVVVREAKADGDFRVSEDGAYLITGGLGALGLHVAHWLVSNGAKNLILTSRRGLKTQGAKEAVSSLEKPGTKVLVVPADISHEDDVKKLFAKIKDNKIPLRGIIHVAGLDTVVPLAEMNLDQMRDILAPKIKGAWLLHEQTLDMNLEIFVCFSSITSVWGSTGRAHYGAANAFLDGLAHYRRGLGLPALSVNWGPWQGGGMADEEQLQLLKRMGNHRIEPATALLSLEHLLANAETQAIVADMDWAQFRAVYEARGPRPLFSDLESIPNLKAPTAMRDSAKWILQLREAPHSKRLQVLTKLLRKEVAKTLGFENPEEVQLDQGLFDIGMDSLAGVELANHINKNLGIRIAATDFAQPNLQALATHILDQVVLNGSPVSEETTADSSSVPGTQANWMNQLKNTPTEEQNRVLTELLRKEVARTLGFEDPEEVRLDRGLFDIGMDSLTAVELANHLKKRLGIQIAATDFNLPNLNAIAEQLLGQLTLTEPNDTPTIESNETGIIGYAQALDQDILEFHKAAFPERREDWVAPRWRWMFLESAKRFDIEPKLWLYCDAGTIVSHKGAIPVKVKIGDEQRLSAWLVESMTLESHRTKGVGSFVLIKAKEDMPFNLSLGQSELMREMQLKLGWKSVGPLGYYFYTLRPNRVLQQKLPRGPVSWGASAALSLTTGVKRVTGRPSFRWKPEVQLIDNFGAEHDKLWETVSQELTCTVVRDASFLNWKYVQQPGQNFERLELRKEGQVIAVAVLDIKEPSDDYHYRRAILVELVVTPSDKEAVWAILDAVRVHSNDRTADAIVFLITCSALKDQLTNFGFLSRDPTRFFLISTDGIEESTAAMLSQIDNWYLTMGDSDIDRPW